VTRPVPAGLRAAARAGLAYFAIVLAAGFVLGTVRTLLLAPALGDLAAVLAEIPFMLLVALVACRWLVRRLAVRPHALDRLVMGGLGFVLLMAAELLLALAFGGSIAGFLKGFAEPAGAAGLAAQAVFGLLPLVVARGGAAR
jgi:hypothetical protein